MALIGTLRNKMGTWVVVFVFVAISAFVLGDLFSGNSNILSWGQRTVGEIAGKEISIDEYQGAIQERVNSFIMSNGFEPNESQMVGIRQQAWDLLIARHAVTPEYDKVGVAVTNAEVTDMISGKNIFEGIKQSFINQETGEFDRAQLGSYLNQLQSMPQNSEPYIRWQLFQRDLKPSRERIKYENLLLKSSYVTKAEAEREYHLQNDVAEAKYLYIPYHAIPESESGVTDKDYQDFYNRHKERFKTDGSRDIKYVAFTVEPSADDSLAVKENLERAVNEFKTSSNDSIYASNNTEGDNPFATYHVGNVPSFIPQDQLTEGNVIGPILEGETYYVVKVSRVFNDTTYAARARHILIRPSDDTEAAKREAREQARTILKDIRGGADFAAKAREFGTDGTASRGGDLGWFTTGQMVPPFEKAIFGATKAGVLADVVETDYGFHIVEVTEPKSNKAYQLAIVEQQILPSDESLHAAYNKAELFASGLSGVAEFERRAKENNIPVLEAKNVLAGDRRIGALGDARQIVQWLYRDASVGEVSEIFDLTDQYVVAVMTKEIKKGYRPLEDAKAEMKGEVVKIAQGRKIVEKLKGTSGTLEEIASAFGNDANIYSNSDIRLNSNALPTVGFDPKVVGAVFALEDGKQSGPIEGENGVVIIELQNKTVAPSLNDYVAYKEQLAENSFSLSSMSILEAIREAADIEDKRYKFF